MTAPLDEKGLEAARKAVGTIPGAALWAEVEKAIRAYLAASPSPSEMEVVQIDATDRDMIARGDRIGAKLVRQLLAHHDQAQSALAAMQMERDEARNLCDDTEAQVMDYAYRLEAAEAQVLRLTEENEALRTMADGYGKLDADYANAERRAEAAEARIKALEEQVEADAKALDEAAVEVQSWGAYASEYFQDKHDLEGCCRTITRQATAARTAIRDKTL